MKQKSGEISSEQYIVFKKKKILERSAHQFQSQSNKI